eukprot:gnl/Dysnectes_brevis/8235_a14501_200.p1 GENE.gnl/Dysnectes_brevis/8235_a14501_200~~gnl/Dysnectes_brevis/8235_a14501_200.p1  ORF type:complete len:403 (+),score=64.95 gnl/Dysnectes_brevis/8235_a14501_200:60-1268(+)
MMHVSYLITSIIILSFLCSLSLELDNNLALTPQAAWNSWNQYHCQIDSDLFIKQAQCIHDRGLLDFGYHYVNLDDCWADQHRTWDGYLTPNYTRFPEGIDGLINTIKSIDTRFKVGIYTDISYETCQNYPGSLFHYEDDVLTFKEWGIEYVKVDVCHTEDMPDLIDHYQAFRDALLVNAPNILYSMCEWGILDPWDGWGAATANSYRIGLDIQPFWSAIDRTASEMHDIGNLSQVGGWLDPDMLELGVADLTPEEERAHIALWSAWAAPLVLGMDVCTVEQHILDLLTNQRLLDVNRDPLGVGAVVVDDRVVEEGFEVWRRPLVDGSVALLFFARTTSPGAPYVPGDTVDVYSDDLGHLSGLGGDYFEVMDLFSGMTWYQGNTFVSRLVAHDVAYLRLWRQD